MARAYLDHASTTPPRPEARRRAARSGPRLPTGRSRAGCTKRVAPSATRSRWPAARSPSWSAWPGARWSSPRERPRPSTPPSGERPGPPRARRCSAPPWSTRRSATPRHAWRPTEDVAVDGAGRLDVDALRERLQSGSLPAPRAGALPMGQPRGGDAPARARGGRAVPGGRRHRPRGRRRGLRARARPTWPRSTPTWSASARTSSAGCPVPAR